MVESPVRIETRTKLIYTLSEAAELEHGLTCCYLFAAFSMKGHTSEGITDAQLRAVRGWKRVIIEVAVQEMLHLTLASNLLTAVGAAPHLRRPNLPSSPGTYPPAFQLALKPFSEETLKHFIFLERPEGLTPEGADFRPHPTRPRQSLSSDIFPGQQEFETVGHLYRWIEDGLRYLADKFGEEGLFVGPPKAQATDKYFKLPGLIPVTDLESAINAIGGIVEQGEGARGDWENAHYGMFLRIQTEYERLKAEDPSFEPARPVVSNPYTYLPSDLSDAQLTNLIDEPLSANLCNLFDGCYEVVIQMLARFFAHNEESDAELQVLAGTTTDMMVRVITPLGDAITALPAGPSHPGLNAGPSFRFFRDVHTLPHKQAAWVMFRERLVEPSAYCAVLETEDGAPPVLARIGDSLARFASLIRETSVQDVTQTVIPRPAESDDAVSQVAEFVTVATLDEVPEGALKSVQIADEGIALANVAGTVYAILDVCPHSFASLSEGALDGEVLTCPRHGSRFNVKTGEVLGPPARTGVQTYETCVVGQEIKVAKPD